MRRLATMLIASWRSPESSPWRRALRRPSRVVSAARLSRTATVRASDGDVQRVTYATGDDCPSDYSPNGKRLVTSSDVPADELGGERSAADRTDRPD
jgi:hypothetical protein